MRDHICPDCGQLVKHARWAGHILKHGRIVPDPHSRTTLASEEEEQEAVSGRP